MFNSIIFFGNEKHLQVWNQIRFTDVLRNGFINKLVSSKGYLLPNNLQYGQLNQVEVLTIDTNDNQNCDTNIDKNLSARCHDQNNHININSTSTISNSDSNTRLLSETQNEMIEMGINACDETANVLQGQQITSTNKANDSKTHTYTTPNSCSAKRYICNRIEHSTVQHNRDEVLL